MAIGDLTALPTPLANAIQQNMLARMYLNALLSKLAYARQASMIPIPANIGQTLTFTRLSELAPASAPLDPSSMSGLDDGMTSDQIADEQFTFTLARWARTYDVNLLEQKAMIADYTLKVAARQGRQAGRTREHIARRKLTDAAMAGNTIVTALVSGGTGSCKVDDIRGFQKVMLNGNLQNVSDSNGLRLVVNDLTNPAITLNVIACQPDSTAYDPTTDVNNLSSAKAVGGISGTITYQTVGTAPSVGDVLQAVNASAVIRPNGKSSTQSLASTDLFNTQMVMAGKTRLANRGVEPAGTTGFYTCICPPASMAQLYADPDFKLAAQGQLNSPEFRFGKIVRYQGVEYVETNEAILQAAGAGASASLVNVNVLRPMLLGEGAIVRGDFKGLDEFVAEKQERSVVHDSQILDGIEFTQRSPLDRLGQIFSMSWQMILDYCVPTMNVSTTDFVPTTDNSQYKSMVQFEHAA